MTMTKAGLVDSVYERVGVSKKDAAEYVDVVLEIMKETLEGGDELKISGFGKFEVRHKGERIGRNPQSGVEIMIPRRKVLRFKVSQVLKDELNGEG